MKYIPDPPIRGKTLVDTFTERSYPRGLPTQQPEAAWQAIFTKFKSA